MNLKRRTKIVCTIGPASGSPSVIEGLIRAGMDVARLNFSHGTYEDHLGYIDAVRQASAKLNTPVAILQDLPGPKMRIGSFKEKTVRLKEGAEFTLTLRRTIGTEREVSAIVPNLPQSVKPGDTILLGDGEIELEVIGTTDTDVKCRVVSGGELGSHKGISLPGISLDIPAVTEEDIKDLLFGLEQGVDFAALSFIRDPGDVLKARKVLQEKGANVPLISKIEKREAWKNLDQILEVSDGLMVARGDLGLEIPIQKVPLAQKEIIKKANHAGKPVITATQMLDSMVESPLPTRAEVTDVANAIFDGTDAIMLSNETAIGRYPLKTVRMMAQIAMETESALPYDKMLSDKGADLEAQTDDAISFAACHTAHQLGAVAIVAFTTSGSTARRVSKYRPGVPILARTSDAVVRRRALLSWGVYPYEGTSLSTVDNLFDQAAELSRETGIARKGDL
ncbi:MAG: pyruvate kinase, partial [Chloroflexi bacterium]|nr:pyruvate kinase [Chloroflexota bacterium]